MRAMAKNPMEWWWLQSWNWNQNLKSDFFYLTYIFLQELHSEVWSLKLPHCPSLFLSTILLKSEIWNHFMKYYPSPWSETWNLKSELTSWTLSCPRLAEPWNLKRGYFVEIKLGFRGPSEVWSQRFNLKIGCSHFHTKNWNLKPETWNEIQKLFTPPHGKLKPETWNLK